MEDLYQLKRIRMESVRILLLLLHLLLRPMRMFLAQIILSVNVGSRAHPVRRDVTDWNVSTQLLDPEENKWPSSVWIQTFHQTTGIQYARTITPSTLHRKSMLWAISARDLALKSTTLKLMKAKGSVNIY